MILVNIVLVLFLIVALNVSVFWKQRTKQQRSWEDLVSALQPIERPSLEIAARNHLDPQKDQLSLEPYQVWDLLGGFAGLEKLRANAELMMELAAHVERWNYEEGAIVCEWIRRDAIALRKAVLRVELAYLFRKVYPTAWFRLPFHLNEAASSYHLMRQRLLALYENNHAGLYPRLVAAL
jgi:hypothetical protein